MQLSEIKAKVSAMMPSLLDSLETLVAMPIRGPRSEKMTDASTAEGPPMTSHIKYDVTDPANVNHIWFGNINRNLTITFTNAEGDTLVNRVRDNFKDEAIVDNGDGTWTFTFSNRDQPERLIVNGRTVVKDVGKITFQDTVFLGDLTTDADDTFISSVILGISGPHPEAESDFTLFCEVFEDALG